MPEREPNPQQEIVDEYEKPSRTWRSQELLGDQQEVFIRHGEDLYRLRVTRHGKLILYK